MSNHLPATALPDIGKAKIAIVTAQWNGHITGPLTIGAQETLLNYGLDPDDIGLYQVPGTVELTFAASQIIETGDFDAIIVIGCVIRGDTPHFDYVCSSVTQGITHLNAECDIPVIFGVLTVDNEQQALDRAGGPVGNKGSEAAETAIHMIHFTRELNN